MTPSVDVVIVTHETKADVLRCLTSLAAARDAVLGDVFVVDNASSDGTVPAIQAAHPHVHVLALDRNVGFAAANNLAIRRMTAPNVLLLNSDTVVPDGAIAVLAARLDAAGATAAGPRLVDGSGRPEMSFGPMLTPLGELGQALRVRLARRTGPLARWYVGRRLGRERWVDWASGACLLVRRAQALEAGLLDEQYFLYEEDVDFCAALRARGGRILYTPAVTVMHVRGQSVRARPGEARGHYDRSHLAFYAKHAPRWVPALRAWLRLRGRAIR
jgi:N-acetylglucosaminyl-diphospho-decaprenol L-rhamnosyltransferase